jgi:hypothetical protein
MLPTICGLPRRGASMKKPLPHQQRVMDELEELNVKTEKLSTFIAESSTFEGLDNIEKMLLHSQLYAMLGYREALWMRVSKMAIPEQTEGEPF